MSKVPSCSTSDCSPVICCDTPPPHRHRRFGGDPLGHASLVVLPRATTCPGTAAHCDEQGAGTVSPGAWLWQTAVTTWGRRGLARCSRPGRGRASSLAMAAMAWGRRGHAGGSRPRRDRAASPGMAAMAWRAQPRQGLSTLPRARPWLGAVWPCRKVGAQPRRGQRPRPGASAASRGALDLADGAAVARGSAASPGGGDAASPGKHTMVRQEQRECVAARASEHPALSCCWLSLAPTAQPLLDPCAYTLSHGRR